MIIRVDSPRGTVYHKDMKTNVKGFFAEKVGGFRLPRYKELPDMGLYLEQVTKYINGYLQPIGFPELTSSMVSNYVKKGVVAPPQKKQYYKEQIAYLFFVSISKCVLSMDGIIKLCRMQKDVYDIETAYDYFAAELENMLTYIAGIKDTVEDVGVTDTGIKTVFRNVIISATHVLFINCFFEYTENH